MNQIELSPNRANEKEAKALELLDLATRPESEGVPLPPTVLVFAHPDDEVVALGARLRRFDKAHFVHGTDGAPRNEHDSRAHGFASWKEYRHQRRIELSRALDLAGLSGVSRESLGIPDQEAALKMFEITQSIRQILEQHQPEIVFTHPYEGGHPDHDACAFAVHQAIAAWKVNSPKPLIIEAAFYHAGRGGMETGSFLPADVPAIKRMFSAEERVRKQALIDCFDTQRETLRIFPLDHELFRIAPDYDFDEPPHSPPLSYDHFPWGMTSQRFCELARETRHKFKEATLQQLSVACR